MKKIKIEKRFKTLEDVNDFASKQCNFYLKDGYKMDKQKNERMNNAFNDEFFKLKMHFIGFDK